MAKGKFQELKGRAKEAVGKATGNKRLKRQGKVDKVSGKAKQKVTGLADNARDTLRSDRARVESHVDRRT
jgi:uncharacterized protein YjbJ (UPF0337 family)